MSGKNPYTLHFPVGEELGSEKENDLSKVTVAKEEPEQASRLPGQ